MKPTLFAMFAVCKKHKKVILRVGVLWQIEPLAVSFFGEKQKDAFWNKLFVLILLIDLCSKPAQFVDCVDQKNGLVNGEVI